MFDARVKNVARSDFGRGADQFAVFLVRHAVAAREHVQRTQRLKTHGQTHHLLRRLAQALSDRPRQPFAQIVQSLFQVANVVERPPQCRPRRRLLHPLTRTTPVDG